MDIIEMNYVMIIEMTIGRINKLEQLVDKYFPIQYRIIQLLISFIS